MDTGRGTSAQITEERAKELIGKQMDINSGIFRVGEILVLKGSRFVVQSIGRKKMKLKLLPRGSV